METAVWESVCGFTTGKEQEWLKTRWSSCRSYSDNNVQHLVHRASAV